ncbi:MAG: TIGR03792 family protein [Pseudanabaenaceae cyanobacterium]
MPVWAAVDRPAIEWLEFAVPPARREFFLQQDRAVWDPFLAQYPAFAGKEVWVQPPDRLVLVLRWRSRAAWKAIPQTQLDAVEQAFRERVGTEFPLVNAQEWEGVEP